MREDISHLTEKSQSRGKGKKISIYFLKFIKIILKDQQNSGKCAKKLHRPLKAVYINFNSLLIVYWGDINKIL